MEPGKENGNCGIISGSYGWLSKLWSHFGSLLSYGTEYEYLGYPKRDPNFDNHSFRDYYEDPFSSSLLNRSKALGLGRRV